MKLHKHTDHQHDHDCGMSTLFVTFFLWICFTQKNCSNKKFQKIKGECTQYFVMSSFPKKDTHLIITNIQ